jgi:phage-related protein
LGYYGSKSIIKRSNLDWFNQKGSQRFSPRLRKSIGFALYQAQEGKKHIHAKPLRGFSGAGVLEIVEDFDGNTYRAVYTVKFSDLVYVVHAFQKKSKTGIKTPKQDIDLIKQRLKIAEADYLNYLENKGLENG